jgi:hypothetical protein
LPVKIGCRRMKNMRAGSPAIEKINRSVIIITIQVKILRFNKEKPTNLNQEKRVSNSPGV